MPKDKGKGKFIPDPEPEQEESEDNESFECDSDSSSSSSQSEDMDLIDELEGLADEAVENGEIVPSFGLRSGKEKLEFVGSEDHESKKSMCSSSSSLPQTSKLPHNGPSSLPHLKQESSSPKQSFSVVGVEKEESGTKDLTPTTHNNSRVIDSTLTPPHNSKDKISNSEVIERQSVKCVSEEVVARKKQKVE